ncbi:alpha-hydroxyketone-type quorum-sensing autoinducer synthase [Hydrogenophaga sp. 5NK40-0174]|uniref:alpha-hydroxyketone-type quorum-sensing autoinducer synthase n=1 Tax=Hydrogenophaga sp. 5NK40-0174 TaxID=3127649 RepID=UPI00310680BD
METLEIVEKKSIVNPPLSATLEARLERDFVPRFFGTWGGRFAVQGAHPGPNSIRLDGNDYLSVTGHPEIVAAQVAALRGDADYVVQSGVFLQDEHPTRKLELMMADWVGKDDGFICQSGYAANVGLIQAVADADTPVYLDSMAHASLWEGAHSARAPAHSFQHNDPKRLERVIKKHGPGLVVVDAVYSTTGAVCPLEEMLEVVEAHGCMILVDESHSLGTHGPAGAGLCAQLGLTDRVHFISASLAKAMAGRAGFFTAPARLRHHILTSSFPNIFSSCVLPHEAIALQATVKLLQNSDAERERLRHITRRVRAGLEELGYPIHQGTEQIIALEAGPEADTIELRDELDRYGVHTAFFCAPATSTNRSLARMTLSASLTDAEVDHILKVMKEVAAVIKPWNWPAARRQRVTALRD